MPKYNGHRSWNAWNIALWISNEEPIYRFAVDCLNRPMLSGKAPSLFLATTRFMREYGGTKTPDGAVFNRLCVYEALRDLKGE